MRRRRSSGRCRASRNPNDPPPPSGQVKLSSVMYSRDCRSQSRLPPGGHSVAGLDSESPFFLRCVCVCMREVYTYVYVPEPGGSSDMSKTKYGDPWSISRSSNRGVPCHAESTLSSALKELKLQLHPNGNPVPNPRGVAVGVRASPILAPPSLSFAECRPFPRRPATGTGVPSALLRPRPAASNTPTSAALSPRRCAA